MVYHLEVEGGGASTGEYQGFGRILPPNPWRGADMVKVRSDRLDDQGALTAERVLNKIRASE